VCAAEKKERLPLGGKLERGDQLQYGNRKKQPDPWVVSGKGGEVTWREERRRVRGGTQLFFFKRKIKE